MKVSCCDEVDISVVPLTMPNAHASLQSSQCTSVKDIAHHAVGLALEEPPPGPARHDSSRILSPMLQQRQPFVDLGCSRCLCLSEQQSENATHCEANRQTVGVDAHSWRNVEVSR